MDSARIYEDCQNRLLDLAATLDEKQLATTVPACPDWTVQQTYAHLAGLCVDVSAGQLVPPLSDDVTAQQVAARADLDIHQVCDEWRRNTPALLEVMTTQKRVRYSLPALDVWHHENDIRDALGMPAQTRDADQLAAFPLGGQARAWSADLPSVHVVATDTGQEWTLGEGADLVLRATAYELARAVTGRRSLAQITAMDWSGDPSAVVGHLPTLPAPKSDLEA